MILKYGFGNIKKTFQISFLQSRLLSTKNNDGVKN